MSLRPVKNITIEYQNGDIEFYQGGGMFHRSNTNYPGGAHPNKDDGWVSHQIRWVKKDT